MNYDANEMATRSELKKLEHKLKNLLEEGVEKMT